MNSMTLDIIIALSMVALPAADVVVLACALTDETRGLVDSQFWDHPKVLVTPHASRGQALPPAGTRWWTNWCTLSTADTHEELVEFYIGHLRDHYRWHDMMQRGASR